MVVTLLLFSIGVSPLSLEDVSSIRHSEDQIQSAPLVTWNVGDSWLYDIELDAVLLVEDSPDLAGSSLDLLYGDATITVAEATLHNVSGQLIPSYRLVIDAYATEQVASPNPIRASSHLVNCS